jgi:hypothetical protein
MLNFYRTWVQLGLMKLDDVPDVYQGKLREEGIE